MTRARVARVGLRIAPVDSGDGDPLLYLTNHGSEPVRVTALIGPVDVHAKRSWRKVWLRPHVSLRLTDPLRVGRTLWPGGTDVVTAMPFGDTPDLHIADSGGRQWVRSSSVGLCAVDRVHVHRYGQIDSWRGRPVLTRPSAAG